MYPHTFVSLHISSCLQSGLFKPASRGSFLFNLSRGSAVDRVNKALDALQSGGYPLPRQSSVAINIAESNTSINNLDKARASGVKISPSSPRISATPADLSPKASPAMRGVMAPRSSILGLPLLGGSRRPSLFTSMAGIAGGKPLEEKRSESTAGLARNSTTNAANVDINNANTNMAPLGTMEEEMGVGAIASEQADGVLMIHGDLYSREASQLYQEHMEMQGAAVFPIAPSRRSRYVDPLLAPCWHH